MKKNLLVSACLYGDRCRYDGKDNLIPELCLLGQKFRLFPFCPEREGGLETPRNPSEIVGDRVRMNDGRDVTAEYKRGAERALEFALKNNCTLALMKAKSPSCGSGKIYDGTFSKTLTYGDGITVRLLKENGICVFDETELCALLEYVEENEK